MTNTAWLLKMGLWDHALIYIEEPHDKFIYNKTFKTVWLDNKKGIVEIRWTELV